MFENKNQALAPTPVFIGRVAKAALLALALIGASLIAGMVGYAQLEHMSTLDAFVNASMLLSGMGPLASPQTAPGKLFAGMYALYSGFIALIGVGIVAAPVVHRFLHALHADESDE